MVTLCVKRRHRKIQAVSRKVEAIEPRKKFYAGTAERVRCLESKIRCNGNRKLHLTSSGSESMACKKVVVVNVGDPGCPSRIGVLADKCKSEGAETAARKSDEA